MSTIEEVLARERQGTVIDVPALANFIYSPTGLEEMKQLQHKKVPPFDFNVFNKSRIDLIKESYRQYQSQVSKQEFRSKRFVLPYFLKARLQWPLSLHVTMFIKCLEMLGTQTQQQEWYQKAWNFQIFGCYAQTEVGHGSDVQNLQTTATYNMENDTFILNTPTISAAKYWPGDLGIIATHAIVFAQMIVHGKNHGVHSYVVPIRNPQTFELLPGIEAGDIGPKYGFHSKDNGFLIMNNIEIPKRNMLRRFVSVSKKGEIKTKGDPKISYATMMVTRQTLSYLAPKTYAIAILIATRYSLFRTQFLTSEKQEIPIIDYQSQKDKIITRAAEYVAVIICGNAVKQLSDTNFLQVTQKNNFDLMAESHACLCLSKAAFTEIVYDGMQICRKSCGGHGFSHYSGLPSLIFQFGSNLTLEGENTIMYMQVTRYLLKNYKYAMTKKKNLGESVKYLLNANQYLQKRIDESKEDWKRLTIEDIHTLLAQASCYSLSLVAQKMMNKPEGYSNLDVWNKVAECQIKRAAMSHANFFIFDYFKQAAEQDKSQANRVVIKNLCLLFGVVTILKNCSPIIEGGFILPGHITALSRLKQILLQDLRPHLIGITDSFSIPEHYLFSGLTHGNPYQNYLDSARKCQLNSKVQESALIVRNNIQQAVLKHNSKL